MMTGLRLKLDLLKEPLGFIKILEWLAAVFAFGSCGGYSGKSTVSLLCGLGRNETLHMAFAYPFRLSHVVLVGNNVTLCNRSVSETHLVGDSASSAQFFVTIAVLALIYSMAALLVYLGYLHVYRETGSSFWPKLDFLVTAAMTIFWLACSSAWAKGLQNVKSATGTAGIMATLPLCQEEGIACEVTEATSTRSLSVSVMFGFLNLILWAGNTWFVYKEIRAHVLRSPAQSGQPSSSN